MRTCSGCSEQTDNEAMSFCDACNEDTSETTALVAERARAAGYAEAVGDIRRMVRDKARDCFRRGVASFTLKMVQDWVDEGAHVGAAKKGG